MAAMLPSANDKTLSRYLLSAAHTIRLQIASGFDGDAIARLTETAAIVARVAQQIEQRGTATGDARAEYDAIRAAQAEFEEFGVASAPAFASAGARSVDAERIEAFLRNHSLGGPGITVTGARLLAGGRCKITALIELTGAVALPASLVLRQDWAGGATDTTVAAEYALLAKLSDRGVRVPKPLLVENGEAALGSPFILVEWIAGRVEGGLYDPPPSRSLMLQLADQLGRIHAMPLAEVAPLFVHLPPQTAADPAEVEAFAELHARVGLRSTLVDAAIAWLRANIALAGSDLSLIHNDFGFHNTLVEGDRLTAVLDWELARIGHPASDLGYIKHFVGKVVPWEEFISHYVAAGGFAIPAETIRFHAVWNAVRLYGLIMQARHNIELGRVNDMEITYACADNVMLLIAFLGQELFGGDGSR
jgi:aminoglycoside phosphotransferase (APT) family kinase protein